MRWVRQVRSEESRRYLWSGGVAMAIGLVAHGTQNETRQRTHLACDAFRSVACERGLARAFRPFVRRVRATGAGDGPARVSRRVLRPRDRRHLCQRLDGDPAGARRSPRRAHRRRDPQLRAHGGRESGRARSCAVANASQPRRSSSSSRRAGRWRRAGRASSERRASQITRDLLDLAATAPARRDAAALRLGPRAEAGLRARQGAFATCVPQGDHPRRRRADRADARAGARASGAWSASRC